MDGQLFEKNQEIIAHLRESRLLAHLSEEAVQQLVGFSQVENYLPEQVILKPGKINERVYFLLHGIVNLYSKKELIVSLRRKGDLFGESSIIDSKPNPYRVVAQNHVQLFSLDCRQIKGYQGVKSGELDNVLYRLFAMILTEKLTLTTNKAQQYVATNQMLQQAQMELKQQAKQLIKINQSLEHEVTERQLMEARWQQAEAQANFALRTRSSFLNSMSHEIRTPLNSIVGFSQLLLKNSTNQALPFESTQYLKSIQKSGQNLAELINNILDLSNLESGKSEIVEVPINLRLLIQSCFHINKPEAAKKQLDFSYDWDGRLPDVVISDRSILNQILMNLLSNAIKFTPKGEKVRLNAMRDDVSIRLSVEDRGIGISDEKQETIFDSFSRGDSTISQETQGTGFGLAISKQLAGLIGGEIQLESRLGVGSTFIVNLPLRESKGTDQEADEATNKSPFSVDNRILVVEDNLLNQELLHAFFKQLGLSIFVVETGEAGIEKATAWKPDLILMDLHLPGVSGFQAAQSILMTPGCQDIPIVALTAEANFGHQKLAKNAGVTGYLTKPIIFDDLIAVLHKHLKHDEIAEPQMATTLASLPDDVAQEIVKELRVLAKIPIFHGGPLIDQLQVITKLCGNYHSNFPEVLQKLEKFIYEGNSEQFQKTIAEALNGKNTDR